MAQPNEQDKARAAEIAKQIIPDCLSRTCFVRDCSYDHCWGCDDSVAERARVSRIIAQALADEREGKWLPIESAPKDGTRILLFRNKAVCGEWRMNRGEPYWAHDLERLYGMRNARNCPPTHWQPLPSPPTQGEQ